MKDNRHPVHENSHDNDDSMNEIAKWKKTHMKSTKFKRIVQKIKTHIVNSSEIAIKQNTTENLFFDINNIMNEVFHWGNSNKSSENTIDSFWLPLLQRPSATIAEKGFFSTIGQSKKKYKSLIEPWNYKKKKPRETWKNLRAKKIPKSKEWTHGNLHNALQDFRTSKE